MTNQLTYTDIDAGTTVLAPLPSDSHTERRADQPKRPTNGGRRRRMATAGLGATVIAALGAAVLITDSGEPTEPVVEQRPAAAIIQTEIDAGLAELRASEVEQRSAASIIQAEIDAALAELTSTSLD